MRSIVLVFRKPFDSSYSISYLFEELLTTFTGTNVPVKKYEVPFHSKGLAKRIANTISLILFAGKIVHVTGDIYYTILGAWFSKRIITIHDLSFLHRTSGAAHFVLKWFWVKLPCLFAHKVTVISQATKEDVKRYVRISESKIEVVYDFVDVVFRPAERNFNEQKPTILQVGCAFNKNLERLIEALKGLNCELFIIGKLTAPQRALLKEAHIDYKNEFDLSLEAFHQKYLLADLLCYTSIIEGFGMPIIEAQSTGLPVITSNCSSMPEVAGSGALFVDPTDISSIRNGVQEVINNNKLRESIVEKGYQNVARFSKAKIASDYLRIYGKL